MPRPFRFAIVFACVALVLTANVDARNKKPGSQASTCNCQCQSDEKMEKGGTFPAYTSWISFEEKSANACHGYSGFGGCRIKKPDGSYAAGTMRFCSFKPAEAASIGTGGVDPTGGNGPTQPASKPSGSIDRTP